MTDDLKNEVFIPEDVPFEYKISEREFHVGPMVLWIAANTNERLNKRLSNLQRRIENYIPVRGLICICAEEGVNLETKKIEGYYFHPLLNKWEQATFSYPGAIFKRSI
ncbi:hypothetical protein [Thalassobacillus sp. C254]|uniref:hypothetical protein n=1 Tax=Thalassobacillus sp. C254 TaxID=1225341 RepID=UPI0006D0B7DD|nr:hypothetical protein [Thalassobacillus sp. C254]